MCMSLPKGNGDVHGASLVLLDIGLSIMSMEIHCAILVLSVLGLSLRAMEMCIVQFGCSHC